MERKPIKPNESIFGGGMGYNIIIEGCFIGALSLLAYSIGRIYFDLDPAFPYIGRTMGFAVLSLSQVVHTFNMRSPHSIFKAGIAANPKLLLAAIICVGLQAAVIVVQPLSVIFKTAMLNGSQWFVVIILSLMPLLVAELEKAISSHFSKKHPK